MPKLNPELRKQFLEAARNQVLVQDRDFTVRQIASDCGVSAGTLYNYFPSKEALIGAVMMEDWMLCRERMAQASEGKEDILEALRAVEAALRSFTDRYRSVFSRYGESIGTTVSSVFERYEMLMQRCPGIVDHLALQDIASFLNVTPQTISKIRKEITFDSRK